jgi:predicted GNAT family N-acyltransferase
MDNSSGADSGTDVPTRTRVRVEVLPWERALFAAKPIRSAVFVQEQGIDESEEWDESDPVSFHALAFVGVECVATGRLLPEGKIGRMAVLKAFRRRGVGAAVLKALIDEAARQGIQELRLSAQHQAIEFYRQFGFETEGEQHIEVGIPHQWMMRRDVNRG